MPRKKGKKDSPLPADFEVDPIPAADAEEVQEAMGAMISMDEDVRREAREVAAAALVNAEMQHPTASDRQIAQNLRLSGPGVVDRVEALRASKEYQAALSGYQQDTLTILQNMLAKMEEIGKNPETDAKHVIGVFNALNAVVSRLEQQSKITIVMGDQSAELRYNPKDWKLVVQDDGSTKPLHKPTIDHVKSETDISAQCAQNGCMMRSTEHKLGSRLFGYRDEQEEG